MRRTAGLVALGGAAAVAAPLVIASARGWWGSDGSPPPPAEPLAATASLSPRTLRFGDPVGARLELVLDPAAVDPASVRVTPSFRPYRVIALARDERRGGGAAVLGFRFVLECLTPDCVPGTQQAERRMSPALVSYRTRAGRAETREVEWPSFQLSSHLSDADRAAPGVRLRTAAPLPPVSYRADPGPLRAGLLGASAFLVLAAGALAAVGLRRRPAPAARQPPPTLGPLEWGLVLAREQAANGAPAERRKALERLARELRAAGRADLAGAAGRLAWSAEQPSTAALASFVAGVERALEEDG